MPFALCGHRPDRVGLQAGGEKEVGESLLEAGGTEGQAGGTTDHPAPQVSDASKESLFAPFAANREPVDLATVPLRLHTLFNGKETGYPMRCRFVKALGSSLPEAEVAALLLFVTSTLEAVGMSRGHFNSVADKVLNKLEEQDHVPPVLIDHLMGMFYDESGDSTWRDYEPLRYLPCKLFFRFAPKASSIWGRSIRPRPPRGSARLFAGFSRMPRNRMSEWRERCRWP